MRVCGTWRRAAVVSFTLFRYPIIARVLQYTVPRKDAILNPEP
jgi:hypothetical protein